MVQACSWKSSTQIKGKSTVCTRFEFIWFISGRSCLQIVLAGHSMYYFLFIIEFVLGIRANRVHTVEFQINGFTEQKNKEFRKR